jgi:hypothetical protein
MNVEIRTVAVLFLFGKYLLRIFGNGSLQCTGPVLTFRLCRREGISANDCIMSKNRTLYCFHTILLLYFMWCGGILNKKNMQNSEITQDSLRIVPTCQLHECYIVVEKNKLFDSIRFYSLRFDYILLYSIIFSSFLFYSILNGIKQIFWSHRFVTHKHTYCYFS